MIDIINISKPKLISEFEPLQARPALPVLQPLLTIPNPPAPMQTLPPPPCPPLKNLTTPHRMLPKKQQTPISPKNHLRTRN